MEKDTKIFPKTAFSDNKFGLQFQSQTYGNIWRGTGWEKLFQKVLLSLTSTFIQIWFLLAREHNTNYPIFLFLVLTPGMLLLCSRYNHLLRFFINK